MTVDIIGIGNPKTSFKPVNNDRFESSPAKYEKIARKLICYYASRYAESLAQEMLASDDIVSNIATQLMMADWRWDSGYRSPEDTVRSQKSYRTQCGLWAIHGYIARRKKAVHPLSLSYQYSDEDSGYSLNDCIADDRQREPAEYLIENEEASGAREKIRELMAKAKLSTKEEIALRLYYMEEMTQVGVAGELGVTRERARQLINNATAKIKKVTDADS